MIWVPAFAGMSGCVVALFASAALAAQPVTLRSDASAAGPVTLGDLFDGAGRPRRAGVRFDELELQRR